MIIKKIDSFKEIRKAYIECQEDYFSQNPKSMDALESLARKYEKYANVLIAYDVNMMGYIAFYVNDFKDKVAFCSNIVVKKQYQGNGVGSQLLHSAINYSLEVGMKYFKLEVDTSNIAAISFYKKNEFVETGKCSNTSIFMTKIL